VPLFLPYSLSPSCEKEPMSALSGLIYRRDESPTSTSLEEYSFA
jgi:hypothetical protein